MQVAGPARPPKDCQDRNQAVGPMDAPTTVTTRSPMDGDGSFVREAGRSRGTRAKAASAGPHSNSGSGLRESQRLRWSGGLAPLKPSSDDPAPPCRLSHDVGHGLVDQDGHLLAYLFRICFGPRRPLSARLAAASRASAHVFVICLRHCHSTTAEGQGMALARSRWPVWLGRGLLVVGGGHGIRCVDLKSA